MIIKTELEAAIYTVIVIDKHGAAFYYVGQTVRDVMQRMNEHRAAIKAGADDTDGDSRRFYEAATHASKIIWPDTPEGVKPIYVPYTAADEVERRLIKAAGLRALNSTSGGSGYNAQHTLTLYQIDKNTGEVIDAAAARGYEHAAQMIHKTEHASNQHTIARNLRQIGYDRQAVGTRSMTHKYTIA